MSNVRNIVTQSLRSNGLSSYERQAEPVIADLERAAAAVAQSLRTSARNAGVGSSDVEEALISAGLVERPRPEPVVAATPSQGAGFPAEDGSAAAALARIEATLSGLVSFASRHGYRA